MQEHKAEAMLYETLVYLYKGDEENAYKAYSEVLLSLDITKPVNDYLYDLAKLTRFTQADIFSSYQRVCLAFEAYTFDYTILTPTSPSFPPCLLDGEFPVRFLYLVGNVELLKKNKVGLLGMHLPSLQGKDDALKQLEEVKEAGAVLTTTLDLGLPSFAISVAEKINLETILVLQTPLHQCLPVTEKEKMVRIANTGGLLITRFAPCRKVEKWYAVLRNRLFAQIVDLLLLVEEKDGGPGWNIAQILMSNNKDVVFPKQFVENINYKYAQKYAGLNHTMIYKKKDDLLKKLKPKKKREKKEVDSFVQLSLF